MDLLLLNGFNWQAPAECTPGLDWRINDAFRKAYLKDTNGESSYDAWWDVGLINGWNATFEFAKAFGLKPVGHSESLESCLEKAKPEELASLWDWYSEKKGLKMDSAPKSESDTKSIPMEESPSA